MKEKSSQSAFFNIRVIIGLFVGMAGVFLALLSFGVFSKVTAQTGGQKQPSSGAPAIVQMVGPVRLDQDLRSLPYIAPKAEFEERVLTRYPRPGSGQTSPGRSVTCPDLTATLLKGVWSPAPTIPSPLLTFEGVAEAQSGCGCEPPDTDGDVGPNH